MTGFAIVFAVLIVPVKSAEMTVVVGFVLLIVEIARSAAKVH